ncbi:hypothetical protein NDU88_002360 [Pleurodeles waltl]|uniref:Uncharacterized protein n=1 Tax=Pleurodeles waltl TaxID=8319 RepID=A0AAV7TMW7_PLEWA|nr:hypothetical protein NDU88_002360 [Pleurodeles waltl]
MPTSGGEEKEPEGNREKKKDTGLTAQGLRLRSEGRLEEQPYHNRSVQPADRIAETTQTDSGAEEEHHDRRRNPGKSEEARHIPGGTWLFQVYDRLRSQIILMLKRGVVVREWYGGEEDNRREKEGRHGRQGVPRRIQRIPELGGAGRTISILQAKGEQEEAGSPILGRRRQIPGSKK